MIEFCAVSKNFGPVRVLREVSFRIMPGHTVGLVGENGAGKSTLMNLVGGNLLPDAGFLRVDGKPFAPRNPTDATREGIAFIHQELNLFPNLSIAENIFLTNFPTVGHVLVDRTAAHRQTLGLLEQVGLRHSPGTLVERLSAGECQLVEIAKALSVKARLMIFDEPTTSLSAREKERLFALIARLRSQGVSLLYISHELGDVLRLCDDVVVLRDGEVVNAGPVAGFDPARLIALMVGRSLNQLFPARAAVPKPEVIFEARQLSQPGTVRNINFQLHRGEVLGVAGLMGSGRSELARILFGLDPCRQGDVWLEGKSLSLLSPSQRIRLGLAFLTENRRGEGLCLEASIADNLSLVALRRFASSWLGWLDSSKLAQAVRTLRESVRVTPTVRDDQPVKTLSGGNQQKVVMGKWLLAKPKVLILDEPTRGVDVGAKYELYQLIDQLTVGGAAVLVISSEIEELIGICDRILVMSQGEFRDELPRAEFDRERILRAALGSGPQDSVRPGAKVSEEFAANATRIKPVTSRRQLFLLLLNNVPLLLFALLLGLFGSLAPKFLTGSNLLNLTIQASSTAVVAIGMTFVLLTAGVDLSVGAIMFVAAAVAGKLILAHTPLVAVLLVMATIGLMFGLINAFLVARLRIVAFIVTLATLYLGRGLALWITETRAMNLPTSFLSFGTQRLLGIPVPLWVFMVVLILAHAVLRYTPFGRQLFAVGQDLEHARKAGIQPGRILLVVYLVSGLCASIGGMLLLAQLGAVSPTFGTNKEFSAIAAAVLGGASLFGGRGQVFPGTVLGALLMQSIENGLVILNADPYLYPLITSAIIFLAVLIDSLRNRVLASIQGRKIRLEEVPG